MSEGKTPGRLAYEELSRRVGSEYDSWEKLPGDLRAAHEASVAAASAAAHERAAELVSEVNELRAERDMLRESLADAAGHVEPVDQNSELAIARWQALAAGRDSECPIEARFPGEVWPCTYKRGHAGPHSFVDSIVRDKPGAEPAVVTSGTEHLAELIGGLAIGGEEPA